MPKEQLLHRLHRVEKSLANYRGKYSEVRLTWNIQEVGFLNPS